MSSLLVLPSLDKFNHFKNLTCPKSMQYYAEKFWSGSRMIISEPPSQNIFIRLGLISQQDNVPIICLRKCRRYTGYQVSLEATQKHEVIYRRKYLSSNSFDPLQVMPKEWSYQVQKRSIIMYEASVVDPHWYRNPAFGSKADPDPGFLWPKVVHVNHKNLFGSKLIKFFLDLHWVPLCFRKWQ